jgi:hypothetical protein
MSTKEEEYLKVFQSDAAVSYVGVELEAFNWFALCMVYLSLLIVVDPGVTEPAHSMRMEGRFSNKDDLMKAMHFGLEESEENNLAHMCAPTENVSVSRDDWRKMTGRNKLNRKQMKLKNLEFTREEKRLVKEMSFKTDDLEEQIDFITRDLQLLPRKLKAISQHNYQVRLTLMSG